MNAEPSMPRRVRRQRRTKLEIDTRVVESARSLFARKGYSETTLREIADLADVLEPALYRRFPSKAALFEAVILAPLNDLIASYVATVQLASLESPLSVEERVRRFIPPLFQLMVSERQSILALLSAGEFHPEEFPRSQNFLAMIGQLVETVVPHVSVDLDARAALFSAFGLVLGVSLLSGEPNVANGSYLANRDRVVEELVAFTLGGVRGRAGGPTPRQGGLSAETEQLLDRVAEAERRAIRAELELQILKGAGMLQSESRGG